MRKTLFYIYLFYFLVNTSQAQMTMDTIMLPEVRLIENRLSTHEIGNQINNIAPASLGEGNISLASLISNSSSIYIKKYGALATPSFRGTSSAHTLVLWNGIPINSIANGLSDFSSVYCHNFSDVFIVHGGNASLFGSGAVGGSIHLNTNLLERNEFLFSLTKGSYGLMSNSLSFSVNNGKISAKGSLNYLNHDNNFEYINTARINHPLSTNEYGKIKTNSQYLDVRYNFNTNTRYNFSFWASDLEREVMQNMTISFSDAMQYDKFKRVLLSFNHKLNDLTFVIKQAYLQEDFVYTELVKDIYSHYLTESYISDADIKLLKGKYLFNLGAGFTENRLNNNNYASMLKMERSITGFSALQYKSTYLALNAVLRKEWQTAFKAPLVPTIASEVQLNRSIKIRAKYNRNFRSPTFNDRFWVGGGSQGNTDLVPEVAWNKELGLDFYIKNFNISVTAYNLNISDMILWQKMDNGIWMPNNIKKVFSRGIESSVNFKLKSFSLYGNYAFTKSTSEVATDILDNSVGVQLRYVPLHKANISLMMEKGNLKLCLSNSYTGEVIATYGSFKNTKLDSFILSDFFIKYKLRNSPISVTIKAKNLMDKSYVTYQNYPNPGREYLLTLDYIIN